MFVVSILTSVFNSHSMFVVSHSHSVFVVFHSHSVFVVFHSLSMFVDSHPHVQYMCFLFPIITVYSCLSFLQYYVLAILNSQPQVCMYLCLFCVFCVGWRLLPNCLPQLPGLHDQYDERRFESGQCVQGSNWR